MISAHAAESEEEEVRGGPWVDNVSNLLGFRINMTPIMIETNSLLVDSTDIDKQSRVTLGDTPWIQLFVAGPVYKNISFFSELEYAPSSFKFNWFYFNFTRLAGSRALNLQVGKISPLEFASYPNRLPQLPALKGLVFLEKSSGGAGEVSVDMSSARPGIQYYGHTPWLLGYAGVSPGPSAANKNQFIQYWSGVVLRAPEGSLGSFEGSTATVHYYGGTDTKNTGRAQQIENEFWRFSPQVNVRWSEMLDIQAAYVLAHDDNYGLLASPTSDFEYSGVAVEAGFMPRSEWHFGLHYDNFESDAEVAGTPVLQGHRIVPAITYVINENIRGTIYWEADLTDKPSDSKVARLYLNIRSMF